MDKSEVFFLEEIYNLIIFILFKLEINDFFSFLVVVNFEKIF